jgi:hypothetical protein
MLLGVLVGQFLRAVDLALRLAGGRRERVEIITAEVPDPAQRGPFRRETRSWGPGGDSRATITGA